MDDFFAKQAQGFCQRAFRCYEGNDDFSTAHLVLQTMARCLMLVERIDAAGASQRDWHAGCEPGLFCDRTGAASSEVPGICRPLLAAGETCSTDSACASDLCGADKTCAVRGCFR